MRTAIKQDLSTDLELLHYDILDVLGIKPNATSHPDIGSLKIVIEEVWKKCLKNSF